MARLAIFLGLGPLIGMMIILTPVSLLILPLAFPFVYAAGLAPALATGLVDAVLARRLRLLPRAAAAGLTGFLATAALHQVMMGELGAASAVQFGLIGVVPGVICSLLAGVRWSALAAPGPS